MTRDVVISGSRATTHRPAQDYEDLFAEFVAPFVSAQSRVLIGGAMGIDTLALAWLLERTWVRIQVAVPGTVADQPDEAQHVISKGQSAGRTEVVELAHPEFPSPAAYHARNQWMVDRGGLLVAFPHGHDQNSGTWYTIAYADRRGLPRLIIPI